MTVTEAPPTEPEQPEPAIETTGLHDRDNGARAAAVLSAYQRGPVGACLAAAFREASQQFDAAADATTTARKRGWQSLSKEYRMVAGRVLILAQDIEALESSPDNFQIEVPLSEVIDTEAIVNDPATIHVQRADEQPSAEDTMAYLRGDDSTLTARQAKASAPGPRVEQPAADDNTTPATSELNREASQMTQTFPMNGGAEDPFVDPSPTAYTRSVPLEAKLWPDVRPYSFADLMTQAAAPADLAHWSWSQLTTIEDCGLKYRAQRIDARPQRPMWSQVGGKTFHAIAEVFDRAAHVAGGADRVDLSMFGDLDIEWRNVFHKTIADTTMESGVSMGEDGTNWYASNSGKEGYTWWLVEGSRMLTMYVEHRRKLDALRRDASGVPAWFLQLGNDGPAIEWEYSRVVPTPSGIVTVKGVIDRAYIMQGDHTKDEPIHIHIEDLKTGARVSGDDTGQLGEYAHALKNLFVNIATPGADTMKITGAFYDARRGITTTPVDLLKRHPADEYAYRYGVAEYQRRGGIYQARTSVFCKSCSVNAWCPVGGAAKPNAS